jgi:hypothetical protein
MEGMYVWVGKYMATTVKHNSSNQYACKRHVWITYTCDARTKSRIVPEVNTEINIQYNNKELWQNLVYNS